MNGLHNNRAADAASFPGTLDRPSCPRSAGWPRRFAAVLAGLGLLVSLGGAAPAAWSPLDGVPGAGLTAAVGSDVWAVETYDDGTGPALYAGGGMDVIGTEQGRGIFRWDGQSWSSIGTIPLSQTIYCMAVWDGKLVVGGTFTEIDGAPVNRVATWDGTSWGPLGSGIGASYVWEVGEYQGDLIVTGTFSQAGGMSASGIARWDGTAWHPLGLGIAGVGYALTTFEGELIVGGTFASAGGTSAINVARWNGSSWSSLGAGVTSTVYALEVFDTDGAGPEAPRLISGGVFCNPCNSQLVEWNGTTWSSFAGAAGGPGTVIVNALGVWGDDLVVGGNFETVGAGAAAARIALWNPGTGWSSLGAGLNPSFQTSVRVWDVAVFDTELVVAGDFYNDGVRAMRGIARWTGSGWQAFAPGLGGVADPHVYALTPYGGGVAVGGKFTSVGDAVNGNNVALYTPSGWEALGPGIGGEANDNAAVNSLVVHADELHAAYQYYADSGGWRTGIARWDGSLWNTVVTISGSSPNILALASHGGDLYAGGTFTTIASTSANRIARFDGAVWHPLGAGMNNAVNAILSYGGDLIAGGDFTIANGVPADRVARWDGTEWAPLGSGLPASVASLCEHGGEIYAGCRGGVYRWDGTAWTSVGGASFGNQSAYALVSHDGDLYVAGSFAEIAPQAPGTQYVARWDGTEWHDLDGGLSLKRSSADAHGLAVWDGSVWVGSNLYRAGTVISSYLARWTPEITSVEAPPTSQGTGPVLGFTAEVSDGSTVTFHLALGSATELCLEIFDPVGRRVAFEGPRSLEPGRHDWAVTPGRQARLDSGIYFARLGAGSATSREGVRARITRVIVLR